MRTLLKTLLVLTVGMLSIHSVNAQKLTKEQKKLAALAEYRKMIDTPYFSVVLEKAYPKNSSQINLSNSPSISIANGVLTCDLPYYTRAGADKDFRIKVNTKNFIYQSQKEPGDQNYTILITPMPGSNDLGTINQIVIGIITEENVNVGIDFSGGREQSGFQGYIEKYKANK